MQLARILAESLQQVEFYKRKNKHLIQQMVARTRRGKTPPMRGKTKEASLPRKKQAHRMSEVNTPVDPRTRKGAEKAVPRIPRAKPSTPKKDARRKKPLEVHCGRRGFPPRALRRPRCTRAVPPI